MHACMCVMRECFRMHVCAMYVTKISYYNIRLVYSYILFIFLTFQGTLELFSGLGFMAGPPIGGALYQVCTNLNIYYYYFFVEWQCFTWLARRVFHPARLPGKVFSVNMSSFFKF